MRNSLLGTGLVLTLCAASCSSSPQSLAPEGTTTTHAPAALTPHDQCNQKSTFQTVDIKDWLGTITEAQWSAKASAECDGPGFPILKVSDARVQAYLQVVSVNQPAYTDELWAMNLNPSNPNEQLFLDVSPEARRQMWPFYNSQYGGNFYDNPRWGEASRPVKWRARLYGLSKNAQGRCTAIWGVEWGYNLTRGNVASIRPQPLPSRAWRADAEKVLQFAPNGCL